MPESRTVLVVEDQADVRAMVTRVLAGEGYRVLEANDGLEAMEVITAEHEIALVLSDVVMPRMDGVELAAQIPDTIPVLLMTGGFGGHRKDLGAARLLQKPFDPADLCAEVRRILETSSSQRP